MQLPIKETPEGLMIEIPDGLMEAVTPLLADLKDSLARLSDLSKSSIASLNDSQVAELRDRADKAEVELSNIKSMVQSLSRDQWIDIGVRLGHLVPPTDEEKASLNDAAAHHGEFYLPEFNLWITPVDPEVRNG